MTLAPDLDTRRDVARPPRPYVGLVPYDEGDSEFFFGRSTEKAIVAANLRAARLTILYGPSGVGKSSLLMAGVVHDLLEESRAADSARPFAVCVLRSWFDDPVNGLRNAARTALEGLQTDAVLGEPEKTLAMTLRTWIGQTGLGQTGMLLVVLDQFEEYFQYHPDEGNEEHLAGFAAELARVVNDPDLPVHVLLSIREDRWAKLDLFEGHIPSLFANYLRVDHLDLDAAREAIEGPIDAWNQTLGEGEQPFTIEPELVDAVLAATAGARLTLTTSSKSPDEEPSGARVEAPFLQLVLDRLWRDAIEEGDNTLRLARLQALGGPARIVESHLRDALGLLTSTERDTAALCFRYLVSSGKTKIAYPANVLAEWAQRPEPQVREVLDKLCTGESGRILRAIAPAQDDGDTSYELFHDILAEPILAWRRNYEHERTRRLALRRFARIGGVLASLIVVFAAIGIWALVQRHTALSATRDSNSQRLVALSISSLGHDPARSLLLAHKAWLVHHTPAAESAVRTALSEDRLQAVIGHPASVSAAYYSSDGRYILSASAHDVSVNSATNGAEIARFHSAAGPLSAQLSRHGPPLVTLLLSGGLIRVWDPIHNRDAERIQGGSTAFDAVLSGDGRQVVVAYGGGASATRRVAAFAVPGGRRLWSSVTPDIKMITADPSLPLVAIVSWKGSIQLRSTSTGRLIDTIHSANGVDSLAFGDDGGRVIVGANRTARVWDVTTGRELGRAPPQDPPHGTSGIVVALSRHRAEGLHAYLAASATAKTIRVWDAQTGKTLFELHGHTDWVESLAFSPDGHLLASADADGTARVWDMDSGETLLSLRGHKGIIWSADFAPSGDHLVTAGADGTVRIWSTWTGTPLRGNADWVLDATFDPTGRYVLTAGTDHQVRRFDLSRLDAGAQHLHTPPRSPVNSVAYSANDRWFVMASADGVVTVRRASDGRALKPFILGDQSAYPPVSVVDSDISRDGGRFVTALDNGTVMVVDVRTRARHRLLRGSAQAHDFAATGVAFSPDGKWIATTGEDRVARIWDARTLRLRYQLSGDSGDVFNPQFSRSSLLLLTTSDDGTARIWDVRSGRQIRVLDADAEPLRAGNFSPDGRLVATGGAAGVTRIWDWRKSMVVAVMTMHSDYINSVSFSPHGDYILTASDDHTAKIYLCGTCGESLPSQMLGSRLTAAQAAERLAVISSAAGAH